MGLEVARYKVYLMDSELLIVTKNNKVKGFLIASLSIQACWMSNALWFVII